MWNTSPAMSGYRISDPPPDDRMTVAAVFWGAVLDRLPVDANRLIALLYKRLPLEESLNA
jgi:hypothetical protein